SSTCSWPRPSSWRFFFSAFLLAFFFFAIARGTPPPRDGTGRAPLRRALCVHITSKSSLRRDFPYGNAGARQMFLGLRDGELSEMENRRGEHGRGATLGDAIDQVVELANPGRRHDRHWYGVRYRAAHREVVD